MSVTIDQVEATKPEGLTQTANAMKQSTSALSTQIDTQRATIQGLCDKWQGPASDAAIAKAQPTLIKLQQMHDSLVRTQTALAEGGNAMTQARTTVLNFAEGLKGQGWQIAPDGSVSVRPGSPIDQFAKISAVNAVKVQHLAATNSLTMKSQLASFDAVDRQLSQNLRAAGSGLSEGPPQLGPDGKPLPRTPGVDTGSEIPKGKSPEEVKKWWDSVPRSEKDRLLHTWPATLGNMNGIPTVDRNVANRDVLARDLNRPAEVAAAHGVSVDEVLAHPEKYDTAGDMMTRYHNAIQVQKGLDVNHDKTGQPTFLQVYEPDKFGGAGRAAIAINDPDHADNTTVMVPGTSHSVAEGWLSADDAKDVYKETAAADRSKTNAVVAWMGYDAPDSMTDVQVGQTGLAHQGGQLLAADVNALNTTHEGNSHMTVIGHSYGSTTVADAAAGYGMHTNDVVLVGCPGTDMAKSAADFHLAAGGHVYVGDASTDPVPQFSNVGQTHIPGTDVTISLGNDPAQEGYGSTRFKAEAPGLTNPFSDHSQYFKPGLESLFSISDIASGHGDALEHDDMLAGHRGSGWGLPLSSIPYANDPEIWRTPTTGHYHQ